MVMASLLEIDIFASFLVGHECDTINSLARGPFRDLAPDPEEGCFGVKGQLGPGCALLLANSVLCMLVGHFIQYASTAMIEEEGT